MQTKYFSGRTYDTIPTHDLVYYGTYIMYGTIFMVHIGTFFTPITFFWTYFDILHGLIFNFCTWYKSYWRGIRASTKSQNKSKLRKILYGVGIYIQTFFHVETVC